CQTLCRDCHSSSPSRQTHRSLRRADRCDGLGRRCGCRHAGYCRIRGLRPYLNQSVAGVVTGTWPPSDLTVAPDDSPRGISAFRTLLKRSRSPGCATIAFLALLANDIVI